MTMKKMDEIDTTPLAFLKTMLSISGIWPILTPTQRFIRALFVSVFFITSYIVQAKYFLSSEFNDKSSIIYKTYLFITVLMSVVYYSSLLKRKYVITTLQNLIDDWINIKHTEEYEILIEYANYTRKCTSLFIASYVLYATFLFLTSFKSLFLDMLIPLNETRSRTLMYPMNCCIQQEKYFLMLLLIQYFTFLGLGIGIISGLSMTITLLLHICAMFRIIGCLLDNILHGKEKGLKVIKDKIIYARIIYIIQTHNRTFQYIDAYNTNVNVIMLIIFSCSLFNIATATIHLMDTFGINKYEDISNLVILPIIFIMSQLIWLFMFCIIGQHLKNVSESVFYKANDTSWYLMSKKSKILLYLIIARASKPTYISIGNMFVASHEFYAQLVKLSVSYAMVLRTRN